VRLVQGDIHDAAFLRTQFEDRDMVINLVGILNESGRSGTGFTRAHADLPATIMQVCQQTGVKRLLHMSALHALSHAPSFYLRTKAQGEDLVHSASGPNLRVTSFRPSVIYGPGDSFLNRFAGLLHLTPWLFPLACPEAKLQPVYVGDVVGAMVQAIDNHKTFGKRYDLCGPRVYTLRELVNYVAKLIGKRVYILGLTNGMSWLQAAALEFVPGKPFSLDNYRSLQIDSVCTRGFPDVFDVSPANMEEVAPTYIPSRSTNRFSSLRRLGHR